MGLTYTPTLGILPDYFDRFRFFATAAATIGAAVGTLLFSPIFYFLIETYSLRGSFLINAGICLNLFLCGALMKSRNLDRKLRCANLWEFALWKDGRMWLLAGTCTLWAAAIYIMFSLLNALAIFRGLTLGQSTFLVSIIGFSNIGGRVAAAIIGIKVQT